MEAVGVVTDGRGIAAPQMAAHKAEAWLEFGWVPVAGTLNLKASADQIATVREWPEVVEHSGQDRIFNEARIGTQDVVVRRYRSTLEVAAPVHLRTVLGLTNGDTVTLEPRVTVSGCIMAHPKRSGWAESLSERLGVSIVWDRKNNVWDTARRSWLTYDPQASHHVVIQDDAIVCEDLMGTCKTVAALMPDRPVVLSTIGYRIESRRASYDAAHRWWPTTYGVSAVGLMLPTADVPVMIEHCDKSGNPHDDNRISGWYRNQNRDMWCCKPSLVDHRPADVNPTLVKGNDNIGDDRTALNFIGEDVSGLTVDWSEQAPRQTPRRTPKNPEGPMVAFRNRRSGQVVRVVVDSPSYRSFARNKRLYQPIAEDPTPEPEPELIGAGWYQLPDGTKVRGKAEAEARMSEGG